VCTCHVGKTVTVNAICEELHLQGVTVALTGSSGVSSHNLGGQTLHSFLGVGLGQKPVEDLVTEQSSVAKARCQKMQVAE
jgi:hypothetical protein